MEVDVKSLETQQLITYARSVGINPHGMDRQSIEEEIVAMNTSIVPAKENVRLKTIEDILSAISPVIEQIQADLKKVQIAIGLREPGKEKKE